MKNPHSRFSHQRNSFGNGISSRRGSHQFDTGEAKLNANQKYSNKKKGLGLLALDADFPPPLLQQSKTPNNIQSVIRQVNFKRAPVVAPAVGGGMDKPKVNSKVQKVVK